ncbi:benzoate transporter [Streptomyces sp. RTGN2]|uniref:WD40 repeat domain-containing protein n=1 Tax=Streptomyces sp. RTGN2 TaxID=3016525 RepID=UPI0025561B35|nr:benzoate transporter [Streptomyces sp. RTGN2]
MNPRPDGDRHAEIHRRLAEALAELVPDDPGIPPHPYLRRHLAQHAAQGRVLDDAHVPPSLLPWETSSGLGRLLAGGTNPSDRQQWLQAWAKLEPFSRGLTPLSRLTSLHLAHHAATARHQPLPPSPPADPVLAGSPVTPLWSDCASPDNVWAVTEAAVTSLTTVNAGRRARVQPLLVTGDDHGVIRILRHDGSAAAPPIAVHDGAIEHLVTLHEGLLATGATDGTVSVLDALRGRTIVPVLKRPGTWVSSLTLHHPQGRAPVLLAAWSDGHAAAFNTAAFQPIDLPLPRIEKAAAILRGTTLRDGSGLLLYAQHDTVSSFDGRTAVMRSRHPAAVRALLALPTYGHYAVGDADGTLSVHDATSHGQPCVARTDAASEGAVTALALVEFDGRQALASAGADGTVRLWRPDTLEALGQSIQAHSAPVTALSSFTERPGARLITAGADRTVRNWPLAGATFEHGRAAWTPVTASALSPGPSHRLAVTEGSGTLAWNIDTGVKHPVIDDEPVTALAWVRLRDRVLLAAARSDNSIAVFDACAPRGSAPVATLRGHYSPALALVAIEGPGASSRLASASADGSVRLWNLDTEEALAIRKDHKFSVRCLASKRAEGGVLLASGGSDGNLRIWEAADLAQHGRTIRCGQHIVNDVAFAPGRGPAGPQLVTAGQSGTLRFWEPDTGPEAVYEFDPGDGELNAVTAFPVHGHRVAFAAAGSTSIHVWDPVADRHLLQIVTGYRVNALRTAPQRPGESSTVLLATGEAGTMIFRIHHDRL